MSDDLAAVLDRLAVQDVLFRYATALDTKDWPLLRSCFTADVVGVYDAHGEQQGYERLEAMCRRALDPLAATQHLIGNVEVAVSGDTARSTCYLQAMHVRERPDGSDPGGNFIVAGQYRDELVRTPDGWRIARRALRRIWTQGDLGNHGKGTADG